MQAAVAASVGCHALCSDRSLERLLQRAAMAVQRCRTNAAGEFDGRLVGQQRFCGDAFAQLRQPGFLVARVAALDEQRDAVRCDAAREVAGLQLLLHAACQCVQHFLGHDRSVLELDVVEAVRRQVGNGTQAGLEWLRRARLAPIR